MHILEHEISSGPSGSVFSPACGSGRSRILKILSLAAIPFIAIWKNDPSSLSGRKNSLASSTMQKSRTADISFQKFGYRHCHTNRRTAISHNVHHAGGVELHGQNFHRNLTEVLGFHIHLVCFLLICLIDLQGSQALQIFKKGISKPGINAPSSC